MNENGIDMPLLYAVKELLARMPILLYSLDKYNLEVRDGRV